MAGELKQVRPAREPAANLEARLAGLRGMTVEQLRTAWTEAFGSPPPVCFPRDLLARAIAYRLQEEASGGLNASTARLLRGLSKTGVEPPRQVKVGSVIIREHRGVVHEVLVVPGGFCWQGETYDSLSAIAKKITGVSWNGPRFFGLRSKEPVEDSQPKQPDGPAANGAPVRRVGRGGRRSSIGASGPAGDAR